MCFFLKIPPPKGPEFESSLFFFLFNTRGRKNHFFFHLIFVVMHFWRYVDFRGRSGAQGNCILGGDGCIDLAFFRMWPTMKTIFYCSTGQKKKKKLFSSKFCSNVLLEIQYDDFRDRSGARENLYFRRWLYRFGTCTRFDIKQGFCENT